MALPAKAAALSRLARIMAAVAVGASLDIVVAEIMDVATRLNHSDMACVMLLTHRRDQLEVLDASGADAPVPGTRVPVATSFNGLVVATGRSMRCTDVSRDPRAIVRRAPEMTGARGVLAVPLNSPEGPFGSLSVAKRVAWRVTDRDVAVLNHIADGASIAIQIAGFRERPRGCAARAPALRSLGRLDIGADAFGRSTTTRLSLLGSADLRLTQRQHEVLSMLAAGMTCGEVALDLGISLRTVQHHVERLKLRFHQRRLPALVGYLVQNGMAASPSEAAG